MKFLYNMARYESELRQVLQREFDKVSFSELRTWGALGRAQAIIYAESAIDLYEQRVLNDSRLASAGRSYGVNVADVIRDERYNAVQRMRKKAEEIED